jgi:hypothetical protein
MTGGPCWLRRCRLTVGNNQGQTYDLSQLQTHFRVQSRTVQTLKTAEITVLNPKPATLNAIFGSQEFTQVSLAAGYTGTPKAPGAFGPIFAGKIAYLRMGKQDATTSFLNIVATDCDEAYNYATINRPVPQEGEDGPTPKQQLDAIMAALAPYGVTRYSGPAMDNTTRLPRPKVMQGMVRDVVTDFARSVGCDWSLATQPDASTGGAASTLIFVQRGVPSSAGVRFLLRPDNGLIGAPEQTLDGLNVRALLNPNFVTGCVIQVQPTQTNQAQPGSAPQPNLQPAYMPSLDAQGQYMVYSVTHEGDTRGSGNDWVTEMVAISLSGTPPLTATYTNAIVDGT